jgi:hypothetical protein
MTRIIVEEDCGNAPKRVLLRDFNIAFAERDADSFLRHLTDTIRWTTMGEQVIEGREQVARALEQMKQRATVELVIDTIITHGPTGAVNGTVTLEDGSRYAFCDVYRFSSGKETKIKEITSYVIKI